MEAPKQINPASFTWQRYIGEMRYAMTSAWGVQGIFRHTSFDEKTCLEAYWEIVGYCSSNDLPVRPRCEDIAVMLRNTENDDMVWFHCLYDTFEEFSGFNVNPNPPPPIDYSLIAKQLVIPEGM
jgi:hypothetical protein